MHDGRAFHASLPSGQQGGRLGLMAMGVSWKGADGEVLMPVAGLEIEVGGATDRIVFLRHPGLPDWVITTDVAILSDPALSGHPRAAALRSRARSRRALGQGLLASIVLVLVLGVLALIGFRGRIIAVAAGAVPAELEMMVGRAGADSIVAESRVIAGDEIDAALEALTGPILEGIGETRWEYRFRVIDDETVNAFAFPGGEVFVHSGLILRAERAEEVAGVLAHEMAHVEQRHGMRAVVAKLGLALAVRMIVGDVTGIDGMLIGLGPELAGLKFSRDAEREADREGFGYLVRAGIDPTGMGSMFRKLEADEAMATSEAGAGDSLSFLSTHPSGRERFEALDALAREGGPLPASRRLDLDFVAFQERIRSRALPVDARDGSTR